MKNGADESPPRFIFWGSGEHQSMRRQTALAAVRFASQQAFRWRIPMLAG